MCLSSTIAEKIEKLDEIDHRIIAVSPFTSIFSLFMYNYISFRTSHHLCHWWQRDGQQSITANFCYSPSSILTKFLICLNYGCWGASSLNSSTLLGVTQELEWVRNLLKLSQNLGFRKGAFHVQYMISYLGLNTFTQLGWIIGDNIAINNVTVCHICCTLDPSWKKLNAKEMRGQ